MAYSNYLLFNNVFLKNLKPSEGEIDAARYLVHESARDWYREENFTSPQQIAENWIKPLLNQQNLDLAPSGLDENAWYIVAPWDREAPLALCYITPKDKSLDGISSEKTMPKGQHWMIRAVNLANQQPALNLRWVVLTNGIKWRLLDALALRRYEAYLEVDLYSLLNGEDDPLAAYLFYRLFRLEDSFERDEASGCNRLDAFLEQSVQATEITETYLKTTVSDNLNTPGGGDGIMAQLCMGFVQAMDPTGTHTFTDQERGAIYRDATYLLYRLLFILYAEARRLLPMERPDYQAVSLNRLIDEAGDLRQHPHKAAQKPTSLWEQLTTLFNAIHYSDEYLGIPPYNGGLFEEQDKSYLNQVAIDNAYLAEALYELAYIPDPKGENPPERIDYRDLSVRHLGSLYEGMIEYHLFIAEETLLARRDKDGKVKYMPLDQNEQKPNDEVVKPGKVYFAQSPHERKATGTHYTAEDLVTRLVKQTVERLLDERWKTFEPKFKQWLSEVDAAPDEATHQRLQARLDSELEAFVRKQVLSLSICDPAMGSGHFLVYIAHTLTGFILQTLSSTLWDNSAVNLNPETWRRLVVENCLFGVDINEMAVELAKLSLWLATMQLGRPLSFLDHHLKRGNSLLGVGLEEITAVLEKSAFNQETRQTRVAEARGQHGFREMPQVQQKLAQANGLLESIAARRVERVVDVEEQEADYETIQALLKPYKRIGDLLVAQKMGWKVKEASLRSLAIALEAEAPELLGNQQKEILSQAQTLLGTQQSIHWPLEFPQIFLRSNTNHERFDVIIGNPPFLGGLKISGELGDQVLEFLKTNYAPSIGAADYCVYFFRKGFDILKTHGVLGLVSTNSISQGDTRESGLAIITNKGGDIIYADRYVEWKGEATVEVNLISLTKERPDPAYPKILDGNVVPNISSYLDDLPDDVIFPLFQNTGKGFQGDIPYGTGFLLSKDEAINSINKNPINLDCLFPYLTGQDINTHPEQISNRYAICFHDWTLAKTHQYPDLINIVETRVKPQRDKIKRERNKKRWWLYGEYRRGMREAIKNIDRVLVRSMVSELHMLTFVCSNQILSCKLAVFAYDGYYHFSVLQSCVHDIWLRRNATTLRTDISYSISKCFDTFVLPQFPQETVTIKAMEIGQTLYEHRQHLMARTQLGMTKTYNRFHDPRCQDADIQEMRRLHEVMDRAVLACYSWDDIDLQHDFYPNDRKKFRYMPSREAQREIFSRLLELNQQIAAEEADQRLVVEAGEDEDEANDEE